MNEDLSRRFADYLRGELGRRETTIAAYLRHLRYLEADVGKPAEEIRSTDLRAYLLREWRAGRIAHETIKSRVTAVRRLHAWAVLEGLWSSDVDRIKTPAVSDSEPSLPLTIEEARALLNSCHLVSEYRLVFYGLYAGTRVSESAAMRAEHWKGGVLYFRGAKTGKMREVPIQIRQP